ncbi:MAG: outer membrane protein [Candidatus Tokpelaia sp. JSC085]|nr:MAG: outer membrane protein [Candidatus Tokpelaia sp. JSC085]
MKKVLLIIFFVSWMIFTICNSISAETLIGALSKAYRSNSALNSDRATVRIYDESVMIAKAGYRPSVNAFGSSLRGHHSGTPDNTVGSIGIQLDQKIFDGFMTRNSVASAEVQARAQREFLRNSEQNLLLQAVQAYANVYAARRIEVYRKENLSALKRQVQASIARVTAGEGTQTDLAQSEAQRSQALSLLHQASADVKLQEAVYRRIIGDNAGPLELPPDSKNLPGNMEDGFRIAYSEHPAIRSAKYVVSVASYAVKIKEGALLPQLDLIASTSYDKVYSGIGFSDHSIGIRFSIPIYQGGALSAQVRQSKEKLLQAQIQEVSIREQVREQLVSAWSQLKGAQSAVFAYRDSVRASKIALEGRIQENRIGQATVLDVFNSRAIMNDSHINLVLAERDAVIAGYAVKLALGRLTASNLGVRPVES